MKDKIVAAELGAAVLREEAPKPAPVAVARPEPPAPPTAAVTAKAPAPPPLAAKTKAPKPPRHLLETAVDTFERKFQGGGAGHRRGQPQAARLYPRQCVVRLRLRHEPRLGLEPGADHAVADELLGRAASRCWRARPRSFVRCRPIWWPRPTSRSASISAARSLRSRLRANGELNFRSSRNIALTLKERGGVVSAGPGR